MDKFILKTSEMENATQALSQIVKRQSDTLGGWTLLGYSQFLKQLPNRIRKILEIEEGDRRLVIEDADYKIPDTINDPDMVSAIKDEGGDLTVPLRGKFSLYEGDKLLERSNPRLIARIPFPTRNGTFLLGGNEFTVRKQLRLSPGVYTSKRHDGRVHTMINSARRQSSNIYMDPESHKFDFLIGGSSIPFYSVLSSLGVSENDMRKAWGGEIYQRNIVSPRANENNIKKLYSKMHMGAQVEDISEAKGAINKAFKETTLDPWVTKRTLNKAYGNVTPEMLMRSSRKMLDVSSGAAESDSREGLHFKTPFDIGMMVEYALEKARPRIQYKLRSRMRNKDDLPSIITRPLHSLNRTITSKYNEDELAHTPDQYNPLGIYSDSTEVTLMGEGGITSRHQITEETRGVIDSMAGFIDPLHSPEGGGLGVNLHLSNRAHIVGSKLLMDGVYDRKGNRITVTPRDIYDKVMALPGEIKFKDGKPVLPQGTRTKVNVLHKGIMREMPIGKVDLTMGEGPSRNFGLSGYVPFVSHDSGGRVASAIKQLGQAVPLSNPEAPLVRAVAASGNTVGNNFYNKMNTTLPEYVGKATVTRVGDNAIYVKDSKGKTRKIAYQKDYQLNGHSSMREKPIVRAGDVVTPGQVLAENQFSRDGKLALGTNLDVAFMSWHGYNHQDALVVSESAQKKLTSEHSYRKEFSRESQDIYNKKKFLSHYPHKFKKDQLSNLDEDGVITVGSILQPGDPLALKLTPQELTEDDVRRGRISKAFKRPLRDDDKTWDGDYPAIVKKVIKGKKGYNVILGTMEPAAIGDKLSNFHGAKGVISKIVPDADMPHYEDGTVPDILQNPAAVASRMNIGQILESSAARIAQSTGKPYLVNNFVDDKDSKIIRKELFDHGLATRDEDGEIDAQRTLIMPDGKTVRVFGGPQYFAKMKQVASQYYGARGRKGEYDVVSRRPIKGPKLDPLGMYSLLSHGAVENLREMSGVKSERNDDFWRKLETGAALPAPKTTFAMDKLVSLMSGAGINMTEEGDTYRLLPLRDADVDEMSSGEVADPTRAVRISTKGTTPLTTFEGGLYDQNVFGGLMGDRYGHITLADPMPNPVFERPIQIMLGLTQKEYRSILSGEKGYVNGEVQEITPENSQLAITGGEAFKQMLGGIDVNQEMKAQTSIYQHSRGDTKNKAARKLKYLNGLRKAGMNPAEYMISKIPVIPPRFRPVYLTQDKQLRVSDLTGLYQSVGLANMAAKESSGLPYDVQRKNKLALYDSVKNLQTVGESRSYQKRETTGALRYLAGKRPKSGQFMGSILAKREALGGQATIMPDPKLDIDEVRIPDKMAWTMMEPFVMRKLVQTGMQPLDAEKAILKKTDMASRVLDNVLEERPILLSRDPKLHKFNILAFRAKRVPGHAIHIPSLICRGMNADADGDRMIARAPVRPEAVKEAWEKLLPSKNLFQAGRDRVITQPVEESIAGLYSATRVKNDTKLEFKSPEEIITAYHGGKLKLNDGIRINGVTTTPGRVLVNQKIPEKYRNYGMEFNADNVQEISQLIATQDPTRASRIIKGIKDMGDKFATESGLSFRLKDFDPIEDTSEIDEIRRKNLPGASEEMQAKIRTKLRAHLGDDSILALMADSGAKGSWDNIQQMLYSPIRVSTVTGEKAPRIISSGYSKGMSYRDYWAAAKGARAGLKDKVIEVSKPGEFSKELIRNSLGMVVQPGDSEEVEGWEYPVNHPTVLSRYLAEDVKSSSGKVLAKAGTPVTPELVQAAKKARIKNFSVRSPLTSKANDGIYAKDFGRMPGNKKADPGTDIGVISAHSLTEPAIQLMLKSFHTAGAIGQAKKMTGFQPVWELLRGRVPKGHKAALSPAGGRVEEIKQLPSGAHDITIGGQKITTAPGMPLRIKKGDSVTRGQQIQEGYADPKELMRYKGMRTLQNYLVDEIEKNYGKSAPDRRYIEAVVANVTRYGQIEDPGDSDYVPGQVIPVNKMEDFNLKKAKNKKAFMPLRYKPVFMGIGPSSVKAETDWATSLIHGRIMSNIPEMAAAGAVSEISGPEPIMPLIHSQSFGRDIEEGRY